MLHVLMKGIVQTNKKDKTSVKNVMLMSAKSVWSDIIPIVNQKGNRLYDIFVMKVDFSNFCFAFRFFC